MKLLTLKTNTWSLTYADGQLTHYGSFYQPTTIVDVRELTSHFLRSEVEYLPNIDYCWQAGYYLITLIEKESTVSIKAYIKVNGVWLANFINNTNFLYETWFSFWKSEVLATCWYDYQQIRIGSCDWDLTDTPITVEKLAQALYEYPDWVKELDEDRKEGEWEEVNVY